MAIEVDGMAHDFDATVQADVRRDDWARVRGIETLRIPADQVRDDLEAVVEAIVASCLKRTPPPRFVRSPSPSNAGEDVS